MNFTKSKSIIKNELIIYEEMTITNLKEVFEIETIIQIEIFLVGKKDSIKFYPKTKFKTYLYSQIINK